MDEIVLLDTSAWIAAFRKGVPSLLKEYIERALSEKKTVITPLIMLELLSGAKSQREYDELYEDFTALDCKDVTPDVWEVAYKVSFNLRRRGYVMPTVDIVIASLCLRHNYLLVHADRYFELIKKYYPLQVKYIK